MLNPSDDGEMATLRNAQMGVTGSQTRSTLTIERMNAMRRISTKQMKAKAAQNGWKPFTEKELKSGVRPEKDFYYSKSRDGYRGSVFYANDDNVYFIIRDDDPEFFDKVWFL